MTTFISVLCDVTFYYVKHCIPRVSGVCLGRDHMVAGFTTIYGISAYHLAKKNVTTHCYLEEK
jgi:hypothetical protein